MARANCAGHTKTMRLYALPHDGIEFPPSYLALREPNGLLAVGGDLKPARLLAAYQRGIFPWFSPGEPILWWTPDPRTVLFPENIHIPRTVRKKLKHCSWRFSADRCFERVIRACAAPRATQSETWISDAMVEAYLNLHTLGYAHSVEVWQGDNLIGGLYGVALGQVFFGESMFSTQSGASRAGFLHLVAYLQEAGFQLIDCQMHTDYLASMGAIRIPRSEFETILDKYAQCDTGLVPWTLPESLSLPGVTG